MGIEGHLAQEDTCSEISEGAAPARQTGRRCSPPSIASAASPSACASRWRPRTTCSRRSVEASPPRWHLAHVSWFFETFLLRPFLPGYRIFHERFDYLFNSYYEQTGSGFWPRPERGLLSRPTVAEVFAYRRHVDAAIADLIARCASEDWPAVTARLEIGLNHEQQHQELLVTDIKRNFAYNPLRPAYRADLPVAPIAAPSPSHTSPSTADWWRSAPGRRDSPGTTSVPVTPSISRPSPWPTGRSPTASSSPSSRTAATATPALWLSDGWATVQSKRLALAALLGADRRTAGRS